MGGTGSCSWATLSGRSAVVCVWEGCASRHCMPAATHPHAAAAPAGAGAAAAHAGRPRRQRKHRGASRELGSPRQGTGRAGTLPWELCSARWGAAGAARRAWRGRSSVWTQATRASMPPHTHLPHPAAPLQVYEEVKFEPSVMVDPLAPSVTLAGAQLEDGDILVFQRQLSQVRALLLLPVCSHLCDRGGA